MKEVKEQKRELEQISIKRLEVMEMRNGRCKGDRQWEEVTQQEAPDHTDMTGMTGILGLICIVLMMIIYAMRIGLM